MPRRLQNERQQSGLLIVCLLGLSLSPAPPAAGFLVSESLLGSCFGIDRTVSSCNLVVPRSLQTEDQFIFYTHDGRSIPISSWDEQLMAESAARATTFTFYTHDGRAVTAVDHVSDRQKQQPWNANHADAWSGTGYKDTSDPGLSVLRSRYPSQTRTQVQVRPAVPSVSRTNFAYSTLPYASGVKQLQHALSQPSSPADQPLGMQMPETNSSITLRLRGGSTRKGSVSKPPGVHNASAAAAASASAYEGPAPAETRSPGGPGVSEFAEAGAALSSKDGSLEGRLVNSAGVPVSGAYDAVACLWFCFVFLCVCVCVCVLCMGMRFMNTHVCNCVCERVRARVRACVVHRCLRMQVDDRHGRHMLSACTCICISIRLCGRHAMYESHTRARAHTHTHTQARARTHTHTHTHTHNTHTKTHMYCIHTYVYMYIIRIYTSCVISP